MPMTMLSRCVTERYGDPANFAFRGQFYESSTPANCALCGRDIRNVYTLRTPQGRSVPSGECCFPYFKKRNPEVYTRLIAAQTLLGAHLEGVVGDIKTYNASEDVSHRLREWRKLKRQALMVIRGYQKTMGDWLPKPLYELRVEAEKKPGVSTRWFDSHIPTLRNKLNQIIPS
jgi:hypothetical protein